MIGTQIFSEHGLLTAQWGGFLQTNIHVRSPASSTHGAGTRSSPWQHRSSSWSVSLISEPLADKIHRSFLPFTYQPSLNSHPHLPVQFSLCSNDLVGGSPEPPCSLSCLELLSTLHTSGRTWCGRCTSLALSLGVAWCGAEHRILNLGGPKKRHETGTLWSLIWYLYPHVVWVGGVYEVNLTMNIISSKTVLGIYIIYMYTW